MTSLLTLLVLMALGYVVSGAAMYWTLEHLDEPRSV